MDAKKVLFGFFEAYFKSRSTEQVLPYLSEHINWIGSSLKEYANNIEEARSLLQREMAKDPIPYKYQISDFRETQVSKISSIFSMYLDIQPENAAELTERFRLSAALASEKGEYRIMSLHCSIPTPIQNHEEFFPESHLKKQLAEEKIRKERLREEFRSYYGGSPCGVAVYTNTETPDFLYCNEVGYRNHGIKDSAIPWESLHDYIKFIPHKEQKVIWQYLSLSPEKRRHAAFSFHVICPDSITRCIKGWVNMVPREKDFSVLEILFFINPEETA